MDQKASDQGGSNYRPISRGFSDNPFRVMGEDSNTARFIASLSEMSTSILKEKRLCLIRRRLQVSGKEAGQSNASHQ